MLVLDTATRSAPAAFDAAYWSSKMTYMRRARKQVNIAEAKAHFSELVQRASMGEEVIIAKDNRPLAKLVPIRPAKGKRRPGSGKGQVLWMSTDFDETPEAFNEYMR